MSQNVNNSLIVKTLINLQNKVDELSNKLDNIPTGLTTQNADNLGLKILIDIFPVLDSPAKKAPPPVYERA